MAWLPHPTQTPEPIVVQLYLSAHETKTTFSSMGVRDVMGDECGERYRPCLAPIHGPWWVGCRAFSLSLSLVLNNSGTVAREMCEDLSLFFFYSPFALLALHESIPSPPWMFCPTEQGVDPPSPPPLCPLRVGVVLFILWLLV